ncbi:MAG: hypothetical protein GEU93_17140 [Propionibacteriales bacterium]|nr:hypothetical protein [Propionibacteriales bacterium]
MEQIRARAIGRRELLMGSAAGGMTLALTACSDGTEDTGSSGNKDLGEVTLVLDVPPYGKHSPFYVATKKDFWKKRGLKVSIQSAKGSSDAVTKIGAGAGEIGFADTSAVIQGRANNGIKAKLVCMFHYKNLMSVQALSSEGIRTPKDLVGKTIVTTAGDGGLVLLPALAEINGFDEKKVTITYADHPSLPGAVAGKKADGDIDYLTGYPSLQHAAKETGEKTTYFLYSDYGLDVYNNGIFVTDKYLKSSPDQVRAFTAGFVDGIVYTVAHPDEAVRIFRDAVPGISADIAKEQQQIAIDHLHVPEVEKNGFGPMSRKKMDYTLELANKYFEIKKPFSDVNEVYTNAYVPRGKVPQFRSRAPSASPK